MKKTLFILIFTLSIFSAQAQQQQSLLWKVSGKDLKKPSYLYGIIHVTDKRVFEFGDSVMVKLAECEAVVFEVKMDGMTLFAAMDDMYLKDNKLSDLLSKSDYARVEAIAKKNLSELQLAALEKTKPMDLAVSLSVTSRDRLFPVDVEMQEKAKKEGKNVLGIETLQEQIAAMNRIPMKEQLGVLMGTVKELEEGKNTTETMIVAYQQQDLQKLEQISQQYNKKFPVMYEEMLIKRNKMLAERIEKIIKEQSSFVAIGCGHLSGPTGLIAVLQKQGYTLTPVISRYTPPPPLTFSNWQEYSDEKGYFKVLFPGEPTQKKRLTSSLIEFANEAPQGTINFAIKIHEVDEVYDKRDDFYNKMINKSSSNKLSISDTQVSGLSAKKAIANIMGFEFTIIYVLSKDQKYYYEVAVMAQGTSGQGDHVEKFLQSFQLLK